MFPPNENMKSRQFITVVILLILQQIICEENILGKDDFQTSLLSQKGGENDSEKRNEKDDLKDPSQDAGLGYCEKDGDCHEESNPADKYKYEPGLARLDGHEV